MYKKILLKISGELFASSLASLDLKKVQAVAVEIARVHKKGIKIGVVIGGGNIFRGRQIKKQEIEEVTGHYMGMVATIINCLALGDVLEKLNCPTKIISALPIIKIGLASSLLPRDLKDEKILIFAAGTGKPFVTTDTAAVKRALAMRADILLKGTKVAGVYSADPMKNQNVKKYKELSYDDYLVQGLGVMDQGAVATAKQARLPIYIFKWQRGKLAQVIEGKGKGTMIR